MNDKFFIDTNILIYSFDSRDKTKQETARSLIAKAMEKGTGIISYQVIQEFLNVALQKFDRPLTYSDVQRYLNFVLETLCEVFSSLELFHQALEIMDQWRYSFFDSLIIAAAIQADCAILYTEDMQHNKTIRSLTLKNPFLETP